MPQNIEENNINPSNIIEDKLKSIPSTNISIKGFLKSLLLILCTTGLSVQTFQLFLQYYSNERVVDIRFENIKYASIPGITVCYPEAISMLAMTRKYPQLKTAYERYENEIQKGTEDMFKDKVFMADLMKRYRYFTEQIYIKDPQNNESATLNPPLNEIMSITIPNELTAEIRGYITLKNHTVEDYAFRFDSKPVESISMVRESGHHWEQEWRKCFTFFSHLNNTWRDIHMHSIDINMVIPYNSEMFPVTRLSPGFYIAIHAPDEIPYLTKSDFLHIRPFIGHKITFNNWLNSYKEQGQCKDYNLDDKNGPNNMRSNCIKHCIQEKVSNYLNCDQDDIQYDYCNCLFQTPSLWTTNDIAKFKYDQDCDYVADEIVMRFWFRTDIPRFHSECESSCQQKCVNRLYNYDIKSSEENGIYPNTRIQITHNHIPDQIVEYMPRMSLVQFISGIGGLLAIWLGLSIYSIFDSCLKCVFPSKNSSK